MANLTLISTLPEHIDACRTQVLSWIKGLNASEVRPICMTQLATFVDPNNVKSHYCEIVKRAIVSVAIVKGAKNGKLIAAIIDGSEPDAKDAARVLTGVAVPVFIGSVRDRDAVDSFLVSVSSHNIPKQRRQEDVARLREVTNPAERRIINAVKRSLWILPLQARFRQQLIKEGKGELITLMQEYIEEQKRKFNVFEEYALARIVDASKLENYVHLKKYRVDVLIAESAPSAKPLLVIEFDGITHAGIEQSKKDHFRDSILIDAQLPVLRISSRTDWKSPFFNLYVKFLVARLVEVIQLQEKELPSDAEIVPEFERRVAEYRKKSGRIDVAKDTVVQILNETFKSLEVRRSDELTDAAIEDFEAKQNWLRLCDPEDQLSSLGKKIENINAFTTVGKVGGENGFFVKALISIEGKDYSIRSPHIYIAIKSNKWQSIYEDDNWQQLYKEVNYQQKYEDIVAQAAMACALATFEMPAECT